MDKWAGGRAHTFTIRFTRPREENRPLFLVLGLAGGSPHERSQVVVTVNGTPLPEQTAPSGDPRVCFRPTAAGKPQSMVFAIPAGRIHQGENAIAVRLDRQSWII